MSKRFPFFSIVFIFVVAAFASCGSDDKKADTTNNAADKTTISGKKHLNINILLDLSDRIDPVVNPKQPTQKERDIQIVRAFCQAFKSNVDEFNAFKAQSKIRVFFDPEPNNSEVAAIAQNLNASCQAGNTPEAAKKNKRIYQGLDANFTSGLNSIYDLAVKSKDYPGSNIFRFMKDDVGRCIENPNLFRNVLVILTDGYVYYENEKYHEGNRYSYIERNFPHFSRFRNRNFLRDEFDSKNYGLIKVNSNLENLEVIVLELAPPNNSPVDFDIMKKYWSKWLGEMGVKKFDIVKTDQPIYTKNRINDFLSK
jgi:hypothetical protein